VGTPTCPLKTKAYLLLREEAAARNNGLTTTNNNDNNIARHDSDEELGAYIYSIIRAEQLREEVAARNNEIPTDNNNNNNNIARPTTRKSPHALELKNVSLSSHLSSSTISKCNMREKRKTPEIAHLPSSAKSST